MEKKQMTLQDLRLVLDALAEDFPPETKITATIITEYFATVDPMQREEHPEDYKEEKITKGNQLKYYG